MRKLLSRNGSSVLQNSRFLKLAGLIAIIASISVPLTVRLTAQSSPLSTTTKELPVRTVNIQMENGYFAKRTFTGRAVAGRVSPLAFELNGTLKHVYVDLGSSVQKGDTLAELDTAVLDARRGELLAEKDEVTANLELANRTLKRVSDTFKQGHASAQRLDEAEANAISLKARLARLNASLNSLDVDINRATIKAPFSGTITARMLDEGTIANAGLAVLELSEDSRMEARIGMPPEFAQAIKNGAKFSLRNGDRKAIRNATMRSVVPVITGTTRTMMVSFDLPSDSTSRGELINAVVDDWQETSGAWLPLRALSADVRGLWRVYKVFDGPDGPKVRFENVQIQYSDGNSVFVSGTIKEGDIVIADGIDKLAPGQRVQSVETVSPRG
ncbi:efflux RND transporter periplasmic adaptor subunit [Kordiimonas sp. SCSIO 12610]|uniref:efflux RND transporter periplasmic adaptor subunit n=1 Tax=Kordiimonas sp. SCSIO 12610 TaxID=2829597 RepID=UPI00210C3F63|nr:efflux RND transporter periplasmic adaptor subunit [Kordiimonas sp. SCSIO 12610]UTW56394.1 efflux RND transporter periplasmic adaptor subunit [Kordiimonas sp. SCSIO 12610]